MQPKTISLIILISLCLCVGCIIGFYVIPSLSNSSSYTNNTWATYISYQNGVQISFPSDWTLLTINIGDPVPITNRSLTLDDEIVIYSPDKTGVIMISGIDYDESDGKISDEQYEGLLCKSTIANLADNLIITKDPKEYTINNYQSRHAFINTTSDGDPVTIDVYFIKSKDIIYYVSFISLDASTIHSEVAMNIIHTFETVDDVEWY